MKATANQVGQLREWALGYSDRCWAVESARGMGYLVSQQLVAVGERVIDVPPMMASRVPISRRRRAGLNVILGPDIGHRGRALGRIGSVRSLSSG